MRAVQPVSNPIVGMGSFEPKHPLFAQLKQLGGRETEPRAIAAEILEGGPARLNKAARALGFDEDDLREALNDAVRSPEFKTPLLDFIVARAKKERIPLSKLIKAYGLQGQELRALMARSDEMVGAFKTDAVSSSPPGLSGSTTAATALSTPAAATRIEADLLAGFADLKRQGAFPDVDSDAEVGRIAAFLLQDVKALAQMAGKVNRRPIDLRPTLDDLVRNTITSFGAMVSVETLASTYGLTPDQVRAYLSPKPPPTPQAAAPISPQMAQQVAQQTAQPTAQKAPPSTPPVVQAAPADDNAKPKSAFDRLMALEGVEDVQAYARDLVNNARRDKQRTARNLKVDGINMNALFEGNAGTGKTTTARLIGEILKDEGVLKKGHLVEIGGAELAEGGVALLQKKLDEAKDGVLLIDEIYQLDPKTNPKAKEVVDMLLKALEDKRKEICFIGTGYADENDSFLRYNQGLPSRFPTTNRCNFRDHSNEMLRKDFDKFLSELGYTAEPEVLDRAVKRLGRSRGQGFGNARDVRNAVEKAIRRQATRLEVEGGPHDDAALSRLTSVDILGPPLEKGKKYKALAKIDAMIGNAKAKAQVHAFVEAYELNAEREEQGLEVVYPLLHARIVGPPGVGKTTFSRYLMELYVEMGLISGGKLREKGPEDFLDSVVGGTRQKTRQQIDSARGGGLFLDEAYGLHGKDAAVDYGPEAIDTIVKNVSPTPGEDFVMLMAGYKERIDEMFRKANPGLSRRLPNVYELEDFDDEALGQILDLKARELKLELAPGAKEAAVSVLARQRQLPNFGNAGAVETLLAEAAGRQGNRLKSNITKESLGVLQPEDFLTGNEPKPERAYEALDQLVGADDLRRSIDELALLARRRRAKHKPVLGAIPAQFAFTGKSGRTEVDAAKAMGKILYNLDLVGSDEVVMRRSTDLLGQFVNHTAKAAKDLLDSSRGKTLVLRDASIFLDNGFGREGIGELATFLEEHPGQLGLVLLDSPENMARLLAEPRLAPLFGQRVDFPDLGAGDASKVFLQGLEVYELELAEDAKAALPGILRGLEDEEGNLPPALVSQLAQRVAVHQGKRAEASGDDIDDTVTAADLSAGLADVKGAAAQAQKVKPAAAPPRQPEAQAFEQAPTHEQRTAQRQAERTEEAERAGADGGPPQIDHGLVLKTLERTLVELDPGPDVLKAIANGGPIPDDIVANVAGKLGIKTKDARKLLDDAVRKARDDAGEKDDQAIDKAKAVWICQYCHNSNPGCPYKAEKLGGFWVPANKVPRA